MPSSVRLFTKAQVSGHKSRNDLWIIVHGKVYDMTTFLSEHPGGEDILLEHAGTDATEAFEDVGHSAGAREMLKEYCIGEVTENENVKDERSCAISRGPHGHVFLSKSIGFWVASAVAVGLAFTAAIYMHRSTHNTSE